MWYSLTLSNPPKPGEIAARVRVPETSPWFSGHFPDFPVLPGIAQLAMVRDAVSRISGKEVGVGGLRRVRFKQMIRPGQELDVAIARQGRTGEFTFRITAGPDLVCSGIMETDLEPEGMVIKGERTT